MENESVIKELQGRDIDNVCAKYYVKVDNGRDITLNLLAEKIYGMLLADLNTYQRLTLAFFLIPNYFDVLLNDVAFQAFFSFFPRSSLFPS